MTVKQLRDFMLWLREQRISYTHLSAGGVTLDGVVDGGLATGKPEKPEPRKNMFQTYGEELLNKPASPVDDVPEEARQD